MKFERGDHVETAAALIVELGSRLYIVGDEGVIWLYDDERGLYAEVDATTQSRIVQSFAGCRVGEQGKPLKLMAHDIRGAIKLAYDQVARPGFFSDAPAGIVFSNGFATVTAQGVSLRPHAHENRARHGYPFDLAPSSLAKRHLGFLYDIWQPDADREEKIALWQEFGGACLLGIAPTYQRCIVGIGDGCNGKSKAGDILLAVMPDGATCSIAPQEFGQEYRRALLANKRLNVVNELPEANIIDSEAFKAVVTGEQIVGRHIREAPFTFRPKAGHYFAANRLPGTNDQTSGFWRRFLVATFNRNFENDPIRNARIAEEIVEAERAQIVRWFLEGAVRLLRERTYTIPASHHEALARWRREADPIALFLDERTRQPKEGEWTSASLLYDNFRTWAERNGHKPMSSTKFGMRLGALKVASDRTEHGKRYAIALTDEFLTGSGFGRQSNYQAKPSGYN